ncbi:MAG TPA: hypothetical protein VI685_18905 [Candidatus Angelobacter sp.]
MLNLFLELIVPGTSGLVALGTAGLYRRVQYPSPLVWGSMVNGLGPVRAHQVLDYNEEIDNQEPVEGRLGRRERRQQFKVNWGYLCRGTKNTTLFLQALRFEKLKIKESKRGLKYDPRETAIVGLIAEATELRWKQVRWQLVLQLRSKLGLEIDRKMFTTLFVYYKSFEKEMVALARTEGKWLEDMLLERLGLTEWRLIEGGQSDPEPA